MLKISRFTSRVSLVVCTLALLSVLVPLSATRVWAEGPAARASDQGEHPATTAMPPVATEVAEDEALIEQYPAEEGLPIWVLMLFFGCILLLGSIAWPLLIARRRLQETEDEDD